MFGAKIIIKIEKLAYKVIFLRKDFLKNISYFKIMILSVKD
jgi:hypothetical protein